MSKQYVASIFKNENKGLCMKKLIFFLRCIGIFNNIKNFQLTEKLFYYKWNYIIEYISQCQNKCNEQLDISKFINKWIFELPETHKSVNLQKKLKIQRTWGYAFPIKKTIHKKKKYFKKK